MKAGDRNSPEHLQAEVERLCAELTRGERDSKKQRREHDRQQRQVDGLQRQNERLKRENEHLKRQLAAARRAGFRQAAPFAKNRPQGRGGRRGRRAGAQYGRQASRPRPARVDQTLKAPVPPTCPDCGGSVEVTHVASQYQEEIPEVRPVVRRFEVEVGHCSRCQRRVQGRHAADLGCAGRGRRAAGPRGRCAGRRVAHRDGRTVGEGRARAADLVRPAGDAGRPRTPAASGGPRCRADVHGAVRAGPQGAGGHAGRNPLAGRCHQRAISHWLWAFVTPETTVYAICPGRGFDDAATVLGADFDGVLVRDGWVSYRCYRAALYQTCLNHLLQRCKELREDHPHSLWAGQVQAVLQTGLAVRDRCNDGKLSQHGLASLRGRLVARLGRLIDAPPPLDDAERFARHLTTEFDAVFLFFRDLTVDATNWRAEQAIRPAVVIRKVCGGNRTRHGADTQQVLASVVRTARQRDLALPPLLATNWRATRGCIVRTTACSVRSSGWSARTSAGNSSWRPSAGRDAGKPRLSPRTGRRVAAAVPAGSPVPR